MIWPSLPRPIALFVGRVAIEKNIEAFLSLDFPGTKMVVGDGPQLKKLKAAFPGAVFTGFLSGEPLARHMAAADVFVFPSRTDTFGIVLLDALASGVPVAAFPVTGPVDVITSGKVGKLDENLKKAMTEALRLNPRDCRDYAPDNFLIILCRLLMNRLFGEAKPVMPAGSHGETRLMPCAKE